MTTITISTPKPNRHMLAEAFGQNQTAVRFLEAMAQDITVNIPDAVGSSANLAPAFLLAQMLADSRVAVPTRADNGMLALMASASFVGQAPGNYRAQQPLVGFSQAQTLGTSLISGTTATAASIPLAAGTWDISGVCVFNPAATTVLENLIAGVAQTAATLGTPDTYQQIPEALNTTTPVNLEAPLTRIVLANAATVYLVAQAVFTTSTLTVDGYIKARPAL